MIQPNVIDFIRSLTEPAQLRLSEVLDWPPDVFAVTAAVLKLYGRVSPRRVPAPAQPRRPPRTMAACRLAQSG